MLRHVRCGRKVHVAEGAYQTPEHGGAEYESIACFTSYVLNEDMDAAIHSTWLCNELGIDTISAGNWLTSPSPIVSLVNSEAA